MAEIVVGVDGSEHSIRALTWARHEAELRDDELVAVLAWGLLDQYHSAAGERFDPSYTEANAQAALDGYIRSAVGATAAERITRRIVCDLPAPALLATAASASLLVLGARGLGGFRGLLLGSVSHQCVHHASCPTAVIRHSGEAAATGTPRRVVVGVDGSEPARHALHWAAEEARLRGATLEVVHAWRLPVGSAYPFAPVPFDLSELEASAQQTLDRTVSESDTRDVAVVEPILINDNPADALLATAKDADVLVVGSRGLGGFTGLLLGSVSSHVVHHAECPVVVVPGDDRE